MSKPIKPLVKPLASLSLDLDNHWSYMKGHGLPGWENDQGYLPELVPVILEHLARLDLRISVFIVGRDAADPHNSAALRSIAEAGHDIANHSFHHAPGIASLTRAEALDELTHAHDAITSATGVAPTGFRAPSYALSTALLEAIADLGYRYDASTFPSVLGPLARSYHMATTRMPKALREERKHIFGTMQDGFRPLRPYHWDLDARRLLEIPVTTFPGLRVPVHMTYLTFLAQRSPGLALTYLRAALLAHKATGVAPSFLLHPLDFIGGDDLPTLKTFPGMGLTSERKRIFVDQVITLLKHGFQVVAMDEHARRVHVENRARRTRVPRFAVDAPQ